MPSKLQTTNRVYFVLTLSAACPPSPPAEAAGFYFPEVGTPSSLGTGGVANATNTYGADAAWTNPAGMTALEEDRIFAGLQMVFPKIEFDPSIATGGGNETATTRGKQRSSPVSFI